MLHLWPYLDDISKQKNKTNLRLSHADQTFFHWSSNWSFHVNCPIAFSPQTKNLLPSNNKALREKEKVASRILPDWTSGLSAGTDSSEQFYSIM
jgi:hypothetical protein